MSLRARTNRQATKDQPIFDQAILSGRSRHELMAMDVFTLDDDGRVGLHADYSIARYLELRLPYLALMLKRCEYRIF